MIWIKTICLDFHVEDHLEQYLCDNVGRMSSNTLKKRRSINTCDIYPLNGKDIHYAKNYTSSASQHGFDIFLALYTALGYIIMAGEDINVYAQAPPQYEIFYLHVDNLYI